MSKIEDFGSKIGGARKDVWKERGLCLEDTINMTEAEKNKFIKRDNIWPKPDIKTELQTMPRFVVYWRNEMRKAVKPKPISLLPSYVQEYIKGAEKFRDMVKTVKTLEDILDFEKKALGGEVLIKISGYTYDYVDTFRKSINGNKFLKMTGDHGRASLKSKMEKEGFAMSQEELKAKQFPIVHIDGTEFFIEKRGEENFLVHNFSVGKIFYYVDRKDIVLKEGFFAVLNEKNRILFCDASEKKCITEREIIYASQKETAKKRKKKKEKWVPVQFENLERTGQTWRNLNRHIKGEELLHHFGIRGGEFGNWTNALDRQASLDQTYDAFCDLAYVLDIDDTSVSLPGLSCGSLAIAYGSRGRGDAVAHYEPLREVINLTKLRGAGSLGHEWAHALDHLIGQKYGCRGLGTESHDHDFLFLTAVMNVIYFKKDGSTHTNYYENSIQFDKSYSKHGQGYWSSSCELFARAFACYLTDKFKEKGYKNDFLNGHSDTYVSVNKKGEQIYAYPRGEERRRINQAIDSLILNLKHTGILKQRRNRKIEVNRKENNHTVYAFSTSADGQLFFG